MSNQELSSNSLVGIDGRGPDISLQTSSKNNNCDDIRNMDEMNNSNKAMVVFSGGTAFNSVAFELQQGVTSRVAHVLPVSDDGGSTAEIIRVLGGPAVGDIRSRCLRLSDESTAEAQAVKKLLAHRLISVDNNNSLSQEDIRRAAREEWRSILENDNTDLWSGISAVYKDTIRAFLIHFDVNVLRHTTERFDFTGGSVGNFFFAGARIFFRSMSAAIFLYSRVSGIPPETQVLPAVITLERFTLGALLKDGTMIRGQHNISHPHHNTDLHDTLLSHENKTTHKRKFPQFHYTVNKKEIGKLNSAPIERVTYLFHDKNQPDDWWDDKQQIYPDTNPHVIEALTDAGCIIYGMGSLYTSIIPIITLDKVAKSIVSISCPKFLLLNGWHDRETSWISPNDGTTRHMDVTMVVKAVVDALDSSYRRSPQYIQTQKFPSVTNYITHVLYPRGGEIEIDVSKLNDFCDSRWFKSNDKIITTEKHSFSTKQRYIRLLEVDSIAADECPESSKSGGKSTHRVYDPKSLVKILRETTDLTDDPS